MEKVLVDTSILVDFLRGYQLSKVVLEKTLSGEYESHVSCLTEAELLAGKFSENSDRRKEIDDLLGLFTNHDVDRAISQKAGEYRRKYGHVSLPDCIIAATALLHNLKVLTKNYRDFMAFKDLLVEEPY